MTSPNSERTEPSPQVRFRSTSSWPVHHVVSDAQETAPPSLPAPKSVALRAVTTASSGGAPRAADFVPKWKLADVPQLATSEHLGPAFAADRVNVHLFAPYAREVYLVLDDTNERIRSAPDSSGVWKAAVARSPEQLYGKRYHFEVDGQAVSDPYAQATAGDYGPSVFTNLRGYSWHDQGFKFDPRQLVLSEVHVRDMTASPNAPVADGERGTYRGFSAKAITQHYQNLGVGAVEVLPVQEYDDASGDARGGKPTNNHWGYMTTQYFAPERRYAQVPSRAPEELQAAVDAYHQKGVAVVMDVVYNHTATGPGISFRALGKDYFFRVDGAGNLENGAGTGNEFASERPMARRLIVDSLKHFVDNYHIDGFRFDLGSLLDVKTMQAIDQSLPSHVFLTAEPWAADPNRAQWGKGDMAGPLSGTRWSVWNDDFRNGVNAFIRGNAGNDEGRNRLQTAIAGSARPYGFALRPSQSVNYLSSHDEKTVADLVDGNKPRALLGATILLTSQGTPMLGHGDEFMRTKQGVTNAHNLDNEVSHIDWSLKEKNLDVMNVYKELIALRRDLPQFHHDAPLTSEQIQWLLPDNRNGLGYLLPAPTPKAGERAKPDVLVLTNADPGRSVWFKLPRDGDWKIVVHGTQVGKDYRGATTARGWYEVQPGTAAVVTQQRGAVSASQAGAATP